jgi:hypothetical protein
MLLEWLGRKEDDERLVGAGDAVERAVARVLEAGEALTYDLAADGQGVPCSACGTAVTEELRGVRQGS